MIFDRIVFSHGFRGLKSVYPQNPWQTFARIEKRVDADRPISGTRELE